MQNGSFTEAEIEARHRAVLGDGPRILPLKPEELGERALELHRATHFISNREPDKQRTLEDLPEFFSTLIRHPELLEASLVLGLHLMGKSTLTSRERELIVLRTGWLCRAPYEFGEHVMIAHRLGFTSEEVDAIKAGSTDPRWTPEERTLLVAVEELHADAFISDATWAALAARYDERQLIEIPALVGQYQLNAYIHNSIGLRLHEGNDGLRAR